LVAISAWQPEVHGRGVLRLVVVLCGTTAFGAIHVIAEYAIMIRFSHANWDSPPGTGYLTVAVITISAIVTAIMTLRTPQRGRDDEPQTDPPFRVAYPRLTPRKTCFWQCRFPLTPDGNLAA
jgi:hypothetical protein